MACPKTSLFVIVIFGFLAPASPADEVQRRHSFGYIVVTPDGPKDGGDFGKHTPGTKTAGIQEAIHYAIAAKKNRNRSRGEIGDHRPKTQF